MKSSYFDIHNTLAMFMSCSPALMTMEFATWNPLPDSSLSSPCLYTKHVTLRAQNIIPKRRLMKVLKKSILTKVRIAATTTTMTTSHAREDFGKEVTGGEGYYEK
jgi:hypothetical protein